MFLYIIIALLTLAVICLAAIVAQNSKKFEFGEYVVGTEASSNVKQLALALTDVEKVGKVPNVTSLLFIISRTYKKVVAKAEQGEQLNDCEKWLYENYRSFTLGIKQRNYKNFATLPHKGEARIIHLANMSVSQDYCKLSRERISDDVNCFCRYTPLTFDEICALKGAYEVALLAKIAFVCKRIYNLDKVKTRAEEDKEPDTRLSRKEGYLYFYKAVGKKIPAKFLAKNSDINENNVDFAYAGAIADYTRIISNAINSLRTLDDAFGARFFLSLSPINELFEKDEVYKSMDDESRAQYLGAVDKLAGYFSASEFSVAKGALELAQKFNVHFGEIIFNHRYALRAHLKGKTVVQLKKPSHAADKAVYYFSLNLLTAAVSVLCGIFLPPLWLKISVSLLTFVAAYPACKFIIESTLSFFLPKRPVPRMNYKEIPDHAKTSVLVPVYVQDAASAREAINDLLALAAVNGEKNAVFTLLADLPAAKSEITAEDAEIISVFESYKDRECISVFVRKRVPSGNKYVAYERKRGAVSDYNEMILTGNTHKFSHCIGRTDFKPEYVIILDSDNKLTAGEVRLAVNTALHPLNAKFDLLTFSCKNAISSIRTKYSAKYLTDSGSERYCDYDDFYFNLCERSVFCGKGIYRPSAFHKKTSALFPSGKVLSHDILEGAALNTGTLALVTLEDAPQSFASEVKRANRWQRGDWLLLPFTGKRYCSDSIYSYIMLSNVFSHLAPVAAFVLWVLAFTQGYVLQFASLFFASFAMPCAALALLVAQSDKFNLTYFYRNAFAIARSCLRDIASLAFYALNNVFVALRTFFDYIFRADSLLSWTTFASGQKKQGFASHAKTVLPSCLLSVAIAAVFYTNIALAVFALVSVAYINLVYFAGAKRQRKENIGDDCLAEITKWAKDTYAYFEKMSDSDIICDNYQSYPPIGKSKTTSPTNIGFSLLAEVCACENAFISQDEAIAKIEKKIAAAEKLEKWNGHLYNWYDVLTSKPVNPYFISTVDSGNFVACLIVCKEFCRKKHFYSLADRIQKLIDGADFSALIDFERGLLAIGYNVAAKRYEGHYDMLASEARLTAYIASAKCKDASYWNNLSRSSVKAKGITLASWSGTAFEYLMPQLFLPDVKNTLITESVQNAVKTMCRRKCSGFWGISESGYYTFDEAMNYGYSAHGISDLSLTSKRDKCIIAPYASALAISYSPQKSVSNLSALRKDGQYDELGFYEAVDFSGGKHTVYSHMSHHQGMILAALTNYLNADVIKSLFLSDDCMRGALVMLDEPVQKFKVYKRNASDFVYSKGAKPYSQSVTLSSFPRVCMLHGSNYSVVTDDYGNGYSAFSDIYINPFKGDVCACDGAHAWFECEGKLFSPTYAPLKKDRESFSIEFSDSCATYTNDRENCSLRLYAPTLISGEVAEYTVRNTSQTNKKYVFYYYRPLSMMRRSDYMAHPAFCDLFVHMSYDEKTKTVTAHRKPREKTGDLYVSATVLTDSEVRVQCNRENFIGRNNSVANPAFAFEGCNAPSVGDVLFPCIGIKTEIEVKPGESATIAVVTQCSRDAEQLRAAVDRIKTNDFLVYAKQSAANASANALRKYLDDEKTAAYAHKLASLLLYRPYDKKSLLARMHESAKTSKISDSGVKNVILRFDGNREFTKKVVKSVIACRLCGIACNLAVILDEKTGYFSRTADTVSEYSGISDLKTLPFVRFISSGDFSRDEIKEFVARSFIVAADDIALPESKAAITLRKKDKEKDFYKCELPPLYMSGSGGFDKNNDYYVTSVPSAVYSNVVSARYGGFVVTENGGGFTFFSNSYKNKVSEWSNDPIEDPRGETVSVADGASVTILNSLNQGGFVRHSAGSTSFVCNRDNVKYTHTQTIGLGGRVKFYVVEMSNSSAEDKELTLTCAIKPCLDSSYSLHNVFCDEFAPGTSVAVNANTGYCAYLHCHGGECITDNACFVERSANGNLNERSAQSGYNNPILAVKKTVKLGRRTHKRIVFALCESEEVLKEVYSSDIEQCTQTEIRSFESAGNFSLSSSDRDLDILFERLMYQVRASRFYGRLGFYQAGGAIGFRDQLQDCLALVYSDSAAVREHILLCAERQYLEGDVMHWWHPPCFGVRTRITDDKLFLPYVVCDYIEKTGDVSILEEKCGYVMSRPLDTLQEARLEHPQTAEIRQSLLVHMQKAIDSALNYGEHGLLLIGGGDWNDALNDIGMLGRGESVWLTMFAVDVITKFCVYIDEESAKKYKAVANRLKKALDKAFFDGRYARAFTDLGEWLGTDFSKSGKTDLLCQSWAVIAGIGNAEKRESAMNKARELVDDDYGIIKLFSPPFGCDSYYGYISAYPQGVRENGGQYTHAAVWYLLAVAKSGDKELANKLLGYLNPVKRCRDKWLDKAYKAEPYALAGDVYSNTDNKGRAGWSWYTGSAAWLYKVILENMLAVKIEENTLVFGRPVLENAEKAVLTYRYKSNTYVISYSASEIKGIRLNGVNYKNCYTLPLKDEGKTVEVTVLI